MAVHDQNPRIQYTADGVSNIFVYPFRAFASEDLKVYETPPGETPDPATDILPPSAYTVTDVGDEDGGTVIINALPPVNSTITIERDMPIERVTDFTNGGDFTPEALNTEFDRVTMMIQQMEALIRDRGVTYAVTDQLTAGDNLLPQLPTPTVGQIPVWSKNSSGNLIPIILDEDDDVNTLRSELANEGSGQDGARIVGYNNAGFGGPQTVHEALDTIVTDLQAAESNITTLQTDVNTLESKVPFRGFLIANNVSDTNNDIDFGSGEAPDSTRAESILLPSTLTKRVDAAWAAGNNQGGLFSGSVAADTDYHFFVIKKDSDGSVDAGFDTSVSAANKPAGYSKFRRVFSLRTDDSSHWQQISMKGDKVLLKTVVRDVATTNPGTSAVLSPLSVPGGIKVDALISATLDTTTDNNEYDLLITSPDQNDLAPSDSMKTLTVHLNTEIGRGVGSIAMEVRTNTSRQIRYRLDFSTANISMSIFTYGWIDDRGRFD